MAIMPQNKYLIYHLRPKYYSTAVKFPNDLVLLEYSVAERMTTMQIKRNTWARSIGLQISTAPPPPRTPSRSLGLRWCADTWAGEQESGAGIAATYATCCWWTRLPVALSGSTYSQPTVPRHKNSNKSQRTQRVRGSKLTFLQIKSKVSTICEFNNFLLIFTHKKQLPATYLVTSSLPTSPTDTLQASALSNGCHANRAHSDATNSQVSPSIVRSSLVMVVVQRPGSERPRAVTQQTLMT